MKMAMIKGYAVSTIKHPSLHKSRLLIAQPVNAAGHDDGPPQLVIDAFGCGLHQKVLISSDGGEARKQLQDPRSPARWTVMGIIDPAPEATP